MSRELPAQPNLDQLRRQAKDLLQRLRAGDDAAVVRFSQHPRLADAAESALRASRLTLSDAQLVIAREHGFVSWPKLRQHVASIQVVEERVAYLRAAFAAADPETRERLLSCVHTRERFRHYSPHAETLSEEDARLVVANQEGYAFWAKYESFLYLDPSVQQVIRAVRRGDLDRLRALLRADPSAANPRWVRADRVPSRIPNDSIPLHCVAQAIFEGANRRGNDEALARALIEAGAEVEVEGGLPLLSAVSYNAVGEVKALLEAGAAATACRSRGRQCPTRSTSASPRLPSCWRVTAPGSTCASPPGWVGSTWCAASSSPMGR